MGITSEVALLQDKIEIASWSEPMSVSRARDKAHPPTYT